jgi:hypothetical protein
MGVHDERRRGARVCEDHYAIRRELVRAWQQAMADPASLLAAVEPLAEPDAPPVAEPVAVSAEPPSGPVQVASQAAGDPPTRAVEWLVLLVAVAVCVAIGSRFGDPLTVVALAVAGLARLAVDEAWRPRAHGHAR